MGKVGKTASPARLPPPPPLDLSSGRSPPAKFRRSPPRKTLTCPSPLPSPSAHSFLHALATAVPPRAFTQGECWDIIRRSPVPSQLRTRSLDLLKKVLLADNGIATRHFAVAEIDRIFSYSAQELNENFEREAPLLAHAALAPALRQAGLDPSGLDALFVCTCSGYLCPGLSSHLAERTGLRPDAFLADLAGLGCGAAIPALRAATHFLEAAPPGETRTAAVVAVEVCSAAFFLDDDPGVLISACLFADGAAAAVLSSLPPASRPALAFTGFDTLHQPADRERIRFVNAGGKLKNRLHRSVPELAAAAVHTLWNRRPGPTPADRLVPHGGGRDVLQALAGILPDQDFAPARAVLSRHGNMSSPSVLFALAETLPADFQPSFPSPALLPDSLPQPLWLTSFGAGFSAHSCYLRPLPA